MSIEWDLSPLATTRKGVIATNTDFGLFFA